MVLHFCNFPRLLYILCILCCNALCETVNCPYYTQRYSMEHRQFILAIEDHEFEVINQDTLDGVAVALPRLQSIVMRNTSTRAIATASFLQLKRVTCLDLSTNFLTTVNAPSFWGLTGLKVLILRQNSLQRIQDASFSGLIRLRTLDLSMNSIRKISNSAFMHLDQLETLHLDRNSISHISPLLLSHVPNLRTLTLSHNPLLILDLLPLLSISFVDISYTHIDRIPNLPLEVNVSLNMSYCGLHRLPQSYERRLQPIGELWMEGNDWLCDCELAWFVKWAETTEIIKDFGELTCHRPVTVPSMTLAIVPLQLQCDTSDYSPIKLPFAPPDVPNSVIDLEETAVRNAKYDKDFDRLLTKDGSLDMLTKTNKLEKQYVVTGVNRLLTTTKNVKPVDLKGYSSLETQGAKTTIHGQTTLKDSPERKKLDNISNSNSLTGKSDDVKSPLASFPSSQNLTNVFVHSKVSVLEQPNSSDINPRIFIFEKGKIFERNPFEKAFPKISVTKDTKGEILSQGKNSHHNQSISSTTKVVAFNSINSTGSSVTESIMNIKDILNSVPLLSSSSYTLKDFNQTFSKDSLFPITPILQSQAETQLSQKYEQEPSSSFAAVSNSRNSEQYFLENETEFTEVIPIITDFGTESAAKIPLEKVNVGPNLVSESPPNTFQSQYYEYTESVGTESTEGFGLPSSDFSDVFYTSKESTIPFNNQPINQLNQSSTIYNHSTPSVTVLNTHSGKSLDFNISGTNSSIHPGTLHSEVGHYPWIWIPLCALSVLLIIVIFIICYRLKAKHEERDVEQNGPRYIPTISHPFLPTHYPNWSIPKNDDNWSFKTSNHSASSSNNCRQNNENDGSIHTLESNSSKKSIINAYNA